MSKYFLLLFISFCFSQNFSLEFDGEDDFVLFPSSLSSLGDVGSQATLIIEYDGKGALFQGMDWGTYYPALFRISENNTDLKTYHRSHDLVVNQEPAVDIPLHQDSSMSTIFISFDNLNGQYSLYFNDSLLIDYSFTPHSFNSENMIWIMGNNGGGGANFFNGKIKAASIISYSFDQLDVDQYLNNNNSYDYIVNWNFVPNEDSMLYDISGNGYHGTINGATWIENIEGCTDELACNYNPDANINDDSCDYGCHDNGDYSLSFDGIDDYVEIGNDHYFDNLNPSNISIYSSIILNDYFSSDDCNGTPSNSDFLSIVRNDGKYNLMVLEGKIYAEFFTGESFQWIKSDIELDLNQLYEIYVAKIDDNFEILLNGEEVSFSSGQASSGISDTFYIGRSPIFCQSFNGEIHDVKIFNDLNLKAHFKFNSGFGEILYDHSGNGNHGTIYGANWLEYINPNEYELLSPNGGETLRISNTYTITWQSSWPAVGLMLYKGDEFIMEIDGWALGSSYDWTIPEFIAPGDDYRISLDNPSGLEADFSDEYFSIVSNTTPITIYVPNQFNSIQAAIDYSIDGDSILVAAGTYYEELFINNKNITLVGESSENTILDGSLSNRLVNITDSEENVILHNISIINGRAYGDGSDGYGGGILVENSSVHFKDISIENCEVSDKGAGLWVASGSNVTIDNSSISHNIANSIGSMGGGIGSSQSNISINQSVINNNYAPDAGGIYFANGIININRSTIVRNGAHATFFTTSAGIYTHNSSNDIINTIIYSNDMGIPDVLFDNSSTNISYSNIEGGFEGVGNIDLWPEFVDADNENYSLLSLSTCIDTGDPDSPLDPDGTRADMGAYPFFQILGCTDELACNYNESANIGDDSCDYSCHDNGDYSLSFDGANNWVELDLEGTTKFNINLDLTIYEYPDNDVAHIVSKFPQNTDESRNFTLEYDTNGFLNYNRFNSENGNWESCYSDFKLELNQFYSIELAVNDNGTTLYIDNNQVCFLDYNSVEFNETPIRISSSEPYTISSKISNFIFTDLNDSINSAQYLFKKGIGETLYDYSGNANHGTIYGATWIENIEGCTDELACNYNESANIYDGTCDYSCHNNGDFSLKSDGIDDYASSNSINLDNTDFTIVTSIRLPSDLADNIYGYPPVFLTTNNNYQEGGNEGNGYYLRLEGDNNIHFALNNWGIPTSYENGGGMVMHLSSNSSLVNIFDNKYHQVVINFSQDESVARLYIDGVLHDQYQVPTQINSSYTGTPLTLFGDLNTGSYFEGDIDYLFFSKDLISFDQINDFIDSNILIDTDTFFQFNTGSGNQFYDYSGNFNHGSLYGPIWIENIYGCTDELACNYIESADINDGSCDYSCHDNEDYHLYFDGTTGFNNPVTGSNGDGSTYINCGNTLNMNGSFTVGGWVKNDGMDYTTIMSKRERPNNDYYTGWHLSYDNNGQIEFIFQDFSSGGPTISVNTPQIFDELFHLVAVFESGSHLSLYVNGTLESRVETNFTGLPSNNAPFLISGLQDPGWWTWDGILDELFVYEGVLSDSQIHDISNSQLSLSEINLSSYWKFNSGQGNILYDHSGNGNHGLIYGANWRDYNYNSHNVPQEFSSIQEAIDYSIDGDSILVSSGIYYENINFNGKNISVIGEDRETTVIDGGQWGAVLTFENNETVGALFSNFTIQNGYKTQHDFLWPYNYGAGVFCQNASPTISNTIIKNNSTLGSSPELGGGGAGMFIYMNSSPFLENLYIYNNSGIHGGGIFIDGNSHPIMNSSIIDSNFVLGDGGGIHIRENSSLTIDDSEIVNNSASLDGGGIYQDNSNIFINNVEIINNDSGRDGGGICMKNSDLEISNSEIINNFSNNNGGAIKSQNSTFNIDFCNISNNYAYEGGGVILYQNTTGNYISNSTFIGNSTTELKGLFRSEYGSFVNMKNNIIWQNYNFGGVFHGLTNDLTPAQISYSLVDEEWQGSYECDGCINQNPLFLDLENNDFTLQASSPCIDAGDPNSELDPDGTRADMGAYPYDQIANPIIWGCMDEEACNFDEEAMNDDDSCIYFTDLCGEECGDNTSCEIVTDFDGNEYGTVEIGNQRWMRQNLKTSRYNNGDEIPSNLNNSEWSSTSQGAYAVYDDDTVNAETYGNLYNWYAVDDDRGVCPEGFHIPTDDNNMNLIFHLGGETVAGGKLKEIGLEYWNSPNEGATNESGFTALAGGRRNDGNANFVEKGNIAGFWGAEQNSVYLFSNSSSVDYFPSNLRNGLSLRCIESIPGCTDELACNYNESANISDDSCDYSCHDNGDYSLSFDGVDDWIEIPDSESLDINNGSMTYGIWINNMESANEVAFADHMVLNSDVEDRWNLRKLEDGRIKFGMQNRESGINNECFVQSNFRFDTNLHFIVASFSYDDMLMKIYVDGILDASQECIQFENTLIQPNGSFQIGRYGDDNGTYLNADIQSVHLYNKSLTDSEILSLYNNELISENKVAYYKFNQGTNGEFPNILIDHSGNQNHGTINGADWQENIEGCTDELACNLNSDANINDGTCDYSCNDIGDYSLNFNLDGYVDIETNNFPLGNTPFTVSTWFYRNENISSTQEYIFSYGEYSGRSFGLGIYANDKLFVTFDGGEYDIISEINTPALNQWHNLVATHLGDGEMKVYLNGEMIFTNDVNSPNISSLNGKIGAYIDDTQKWNGLLDEIAIWKKEFDEEEVLSLYLLGTSNLSNSQFDEDLSGYWRFNAGNGNILYDFSGNLNHGEILGADWVLAGCTDPLADNYDSFATYDNSSCTGSIVSSDDFTFAGEFNENYYYKSKYSHTWIESFDLALNNNGYLSTVGSQEENDFINSFCEGSPLWIGFTDQENEGVWSWITDEEVSYTNWLSNQPDNASGVQHYGLMDCSTGQWDDAASENQNQFFIMEVELGCTDELACNYNEYAGIDDGSCTYPISDDYNCDGSCGGVNNTIEDCFGVCGGVAQDPNIMLDTDYLDFDIIVSEGLSESLPIVVTNNGDCELELNLNSENEFNLSFDGIDDYATISHQLDLENDFTMEFVFNPHSDGYYGYHCDSGASLFMQGGGPGTGQLYPDIGVGISDCQSEFPVIGVELSDGGNSTYRFYSDEGVLLDEDNHIILTYKDGLLNVYLNEELVINENTSISVINSTENNPSVPTIGGRTTSENSVGHFIDGVYSRFAVYNSAFNDEVINDILNGSYHSVENYYQLLYTFDAGESNIIIDQSENMYNSTIYGAEWMQFQLYSFPDWLSSNETNISLEASESYTLNILANASGLDANQYSSNIFISSNDPLNQIIEIPVTMNVGMPTYTSEVNLVDFGEVQFNSNGYAEIPITNAGNMELSISLSDLEPPLSLSEDFTVEPNNSDTIHVVYECGLESDSVDDNLTISTNDPLNPLIEIPIVGSCVPSENPILLSVDDVGNDQGRWVNLSFTRSYFDSDTLRQIEIYTVEANYGNGWISSAPTLAYSDDIYLTQYHTQLDSTANSDGLIEFRVIAGMEEGNYVSNILSGYSVDNLHPSVPQDILASDEDGDVSISWIYYQDIDFLNHRITDIEENYEYTISNDIIIPLSIDYNEFHINTFDFNGNMSDTSDFISAYDLNQGANLISFSILPDDRSVGNVIQTNDVTDIVGEGIAATFNPILGWVGSLSHIEPERGYWVKSSNGNILNTVGERNLTSSYSLNPGANLISYNCEQSISLNEALDDIDVYGVIGEGVAATYNPALGWVGSLIAFEPGSGYWFKTDISVDFAFDCPSESFLARKSSNNHLNDYAQSTEQAFYFFSYIEGIENGDIIKAFNGETLVGSRAWNSSYTDVPVMGKDFQAETTDYIEIGEVPQFKLFKKNGDILTIESNFPAFKSNEIYIIEDASAHSEAPHSFRLAKAFPNPFNPVTTISFEVPHESNVKLEVYDITGSKIRILADNVFQAGYHSLSWDASNVSSGIYFVKMQSERFSEVQKLMLVK